MNNNKYNSSSSSSSSLFPFQISLNNLNNNKEKKKKKEEEEEEEEEDNESNYSIDFSGKSEDPLWPIPETIEIITKKENENEREEEEEEEEKEEENNSERDENDKNNNKKKKKKKKNKDQREESYKQRTNNNNNNNNNNNSHNNNNKESHYYSYLNCLCCGINVINKLFFQIYKEKEYHKEISLTIPSILLGNKYHTISKILTSEMASELYSFLPESTKLSIPVLLYSTYKDGWSMEGVLAKTHNFDPLIIIIRALRSKVVIGAYCTGRLSPPSPHVRGTGETFVFRLTPPTSVHRWTYIPSAKKESRNQYLVSCREYIAVGASAEHGTNAIRIDGDLRTCSSGPSDTFQNPPLVPEEDSYSTQSQKSKQYPTNSSLLYPPLFSSVGNPFPIEEIEIIHVPSSITKNRDSKRKLR